MIDAGDVETSAVQVDRACVIDVGSGAVGDGIGSDDASQSRAGSRRGLPTRLIRWCL